MCTSLSPGGNSGGNSGGTFVIITSSPLKSNGFDDFDVNLGLGEVAGLSPLVVAVCVCVLVSVLMFVGVCVLVS